MLPKFQHNWTLAGMPCELGMFPVTVSLFIIMYRRTDKLLLLGLLTGKLLYLNGWNLFETYIEYVVGFIVNLLYWQLILRVSRISSRT
ncbi:hypothetical protein [Alicyclobacillus sp. SO9]|uniref:hypothetical protein n=1 Tax=Alicyclobacillus sp. SO9 TaxID=2665646 RepID=UPI0018E70D3F|nr:hypothetical protein [Alicyclobacillus sp. SO9]QQE77077.1 hypothetical protein GI364_13935 [Alicyclobacillus sp. SO9]